MATSGKQKLTSRHITRLAAKISLQNMKGIAQGYLDIDKKIIAKLSEVNKNDVHAFNRDVLEMWAENNQGGDQIEVSIMRLCYKHCMIKYIHAVTLTEIKETTKRLSK